MASTFYVFIKLLQYGISVKSIRNIPPLKGNATFEMRVQYNVRSIFISDGMER